MLDGLFLCLHTSCYRKYQFVDALSSCLEIQIPLSLRRIFEHLRKVLHFLEIWFRLKFCVFQPFYYLRSMLRCERDSGTSFPSFSKYGVFINDITCAVFHRTDILSQIVKFLKDIKNHKSRNHVSWKMSPFLNREKMRL